jgi:hypothetical protein
VDQNDDMKFDTSAEDKSALGDFAANRMTNSAPSPQPSTTAVTGHEKHCFVVMPSGHDSSEQKWFKGWYEVVIKPALVELGYEPVLAAAEEQPGAINDEIRTHLAIDPMVVVDVRTGYQTRVGFATGNDGVEGTTATVRRGQSARNHGRSRLDGSRVESKETSFLCSSG